METEKSKEETAVLVSVTETPKLADRLKVMSKEDLIIFAGDTYGLDVDKRLSPESIIKEILRFEKAQKDEADKVNRESAKLAADDDPIVTCVFHRFDFPEADLDFAYTGTRGFKGPNNPSGFVEAPKYHLFPGELCSIPWSVKEHLESLMFSTWKTVIDEKTQTVKDKIPIIKPKFVLELKMTKEQILKTKNS